MPTHTILGATGGVGSSVLRCLLSAKIPDLRINILVRSKSKLLKAFPQLESTSSPTTTIFEAPISNEAVLKASLKGVSTIYVCVATNIAGRKVDIAHTTAAGVIAALGQLHKDEGSEYKIPVVLFNRSLSLNSDVQMPIPGFAKKFMLFALKTVYEDLTKAGELYAGGGKDGLLTCITADAPGLMDPEWTVPTGYRLMESGKTSASMNYADFGMAIVEMGQRREEFGGKAVGAGATGRVRIVILANLWVIFQSLKSRYLPF